MSKIAGIVKYIQVNKYTLDFCLPCIETHDPRFSFTISLWLYVYVYKK